MSGARLVTVSDSSTAPTPSSASTGSDWPARSATALRDTVRKPASWNWISWVPGSPWARYSPSEFVVRVTGPPNELRLVIVTVTPGSAPPRCREWYRTASGHDLRQCRPDSDQEEQARRGQEQCRSLDEGSCGRVTHGSLLPNRPAHPPLADRLFRVQESRSVDTTAEMDQQIGIRARQHPRRREGDRSRRHAHRRKIAPDSTQFKFISLGPRSLNSYIKPQYIAREHRRHAGICGAHRGDRQPDAVAPRRCGEGAR